MSTTPKEVEFAENVLQRAARVELEERMLGWQLKECPGTIETAVKELRVDALMFQTPLNHVQSAIFRALDAGRTVAVPVIAAELSECAALSEIGGAEYLRSLADASPAIISAEDGRKQMLSAIHTWRRMSARLPQAGDVELVRADTIDPVKIDWLWPGWIARGKFHLLAGSPGTGKTTLSLAMAATITNGGIFPCGSRAERGSVMMWTGEDDLADSIRPRFEACGGDATRLYFVDGVRDEDGTSQPFDPAYDVERLIFAAKQIKDLRLLIVDPVVSAIAGDSHKNTETRRALQPLVDFASIAGVAVLGITHYSKGTAGRDPSERVTGSLAFVAVSRLVMVTAKSAEAGECWRLVRAKSNIGPDGGGFEYDLRQLAIDEGTGLFGQAILWGSALDGNARTLLAEVETPEDTAKAPALEAAKSWLREFLGSGTVSAKVIEDLAGQVGHHWATIRRAKSALGIEKVKLGFEGGWAWRMPKMLKSTEGAHLKNGEHLGAFEDAHPNCVSTFGGIAHLRGAQSTVNGSDS